MTNQRSRRLHLILTKWRQLKKNVRTLYLYTVEEVPRTVALTCKNGNGAMPVRQKDSPVKTIATNPGFKKKNVCGGLQSVDTSLSTLTSPEFTLNGK